MLPTNALAEIGAAIGDPGRACMLDALMDGRSLTARELAAHAGVAPQTASGHLGKLVDAGLIVSEPRGRHRYHRLASAEVARLLEGVGQFAAGKPDRTSVRTGPRDAAMRAARTCYDHFAGGLGVAIADALVARGHLILDHDAAAVTDAGDGFFRDFLATAEKKSGRPCLDWSERRPHLGGALGTAIACRCFELGWVRRSEKSRAVSVTPIGGRGLREGLGVSL